MNEKKKLTRSNDNRVICGVCGGLGEYFGINANIFRVIWVLLIPSSIGIWAYFILAIVLPANPNQAAYRRTRPPQKEPTPPPEENPLDADARNARDADYQPPKRSGSDNFNEEEYYKESRKNTGRWS